LKATLWLILNANALTNIQPHLILWINLFGGNGYFFNFPDFVFRIITLIEENAKFTN